MQTKIVKVHPKTGHEGKEWKYRYRSTLSLTSALDGEGGHCFPPPTERDPVPIVQEAK